MIDRRKTLLRIDNILNDTTGQFDTIVTLRVEVVDFDTGETFGEPKVQLLTVDPASTDPDVQAIYTTAQSLVQAVTAKCIPADQPVAQPTGVTTALNTLG